jgi:hypothetical protein
VRGGIGDEERERLSWRERALRRSEAVSEDVLWGDVAARRQCSAVLKKQYVVRSTDTLMVRGDMMYGTGGSQRSQSWRLFAGRAPKEAHPVLVISSPFG